MWVRVHHVRMYEYDVTQMNDNIYMQNGIRLLGYLRMWAEVLKIKIILLKIEAASKLNWYRIDVK